MTGMLFSHPTGNANVRGALTGLYEAGLLAEFHTTIAAYPRNCWSRLGQSRIGREFQRRAYDERLKKITVQHPTRELGRMLASRLQLNRLHRHETGPLCIDAVYRALDQSTARRLRRDPSAFSGVYVYEDGAVETLAAARQSGLPGNYDLPIGYWRSARNLLAGEFDRLPEWSETLTGFKDSNEKLDRKDVELAHATRIFVASSFTAQTLKDYPGTLPKPTVIPYGFPEVVPETALAIRSRSPQSGPLRLLFVGSLSQRKGIADLFNAVNVLGRSVSLTVIGRKVTENCPALNRELSKVRWIASLPHAEILAEMRAHDVFVFPSLFEGFGLVITEAMSQGTPVITTERTAGPDLIKHNENGWLVKAGSPESLTEQLEQLVRNPENVRAAGLAARELAISRPWSAYGRELAAALTHPS